MLKAENSSSLLYFSHMLKKPIRYGLGQNHEFSIYRSSALCYRYRKRATLLRYRVLKRVHKNFSSTSMRQQFLNRIVAEKPFGDLISSKRFYKQLNRISNNLMMNEFEITLWALLIDQLTASEKIFGFRQILYFTGFACKSFVCDDLCIFEQRCVKKLRTFTSRYNNWLCMTNCNFDISLRDINQKFNCLSSIEHQPSENAKVINELIEQMQIRPRKIQLRNETTSDLSTVAELENQLEIFEHDILGGERLDPIGLN